MKQLEAYVSSFRDGEKVYYLNAEGRERVGAKKVCRKTAQVKHYILRNDLYIACGCPENWQSEVKLEIAKNEIIADAMFTQDNTYYFIEVDHTQKMIVNRNKVKKYREILNHPFFEEPPILMWITTTDFRRKQLLDICKGLNVQVFTAGDFH